MHTKQYVQKLPVSSYLSFSHLKFSKLSRTSVRLISGMPSDRCFDSTICDWKLNDEAWRSSDRPFNSTNRVQKSNDEALRSSNDSFCSTIGV
ncbi:hypothetical protein [Dendronalium sp. ChiSLP03b]|uniref:hypothetical protein n=1 Tax=Dendronalium sp. ChiSLP03b TaxID=3075381 RepID=UPI002AD4665C|nr:hypothetical protein [Dendronalium sp. ChiSLP03b]MDZ8203720.1 hypothetical protein [Dendronalium sp. ChiSLP03b]